MNRFQSVLCLLLVATTVSHASLPQIYWKKALPNTPMPRAIQDLLPYDAQDEEKTRLAVNVGDGGINKDGVAVNTGRPGGSGTNVNVGPGGVGVNVNGKGNTRVGVGKGGVSVNTGHKGKSVVVNVKPGSNPFFYNYAATETQIHTDPNVALFFLQEELRPGVQMNLQFTKTTSGATFLPRSEANFIPFSSSKLPQILNRFSVKPESIEAKAMKQTLVECEEPAIDGESKRCATSLESMVEFSMLSLETRDIQVISTTVGQDDKQRQEYTIAPSGVRAMPGSKLVACHAQPYAYAVFYCHATSKSRAYEVTLVGKDGAVVTAAAVCHLDTAAWNPKHLAFQVLRVKPGSVPVCHFLPQDHLVWSPRS